MLDPSAVVVAFFELPYWAKLTLLIMAAIIGLMSSVLGTALRSRRKALLRLEKVIKELAEERQKLASETRWRLTDEEVRARTAAEKAFRVAQAP